jgi:phytoene dehydrogenase-like protein
MKVVIIGSGMAGLTAGAYLAKAGYNITVLEQYSTPGGVTATVNQDGYGWDIGPLLLEGFAPGDKGRAILEELGVSKLVKTSHEDRGLSMSEFTLLHPKEYEGPYWRREQLKVIFPDESEHLDRYYRFYDQMLNLMSLSRRLESSGGLTALWLKLRLFLAFQGVKDKVKWNALQLMDHYFESPVLKTFFLGIRYRTKRVPCPGSPINPSRNCFRQKDPYFSWNKKCPDSLFLHSWRLPGAGKCCYGSDPGPRRKSGSE